MRTRLGWGRLGQSQEGIQISPGMQNSQVKTPPGVSHLGNLCA